MHYLDFLTRVHTRLAPTTYLEIGVRNGRSLALARCRAVGIDPAYSIRAELDGDFALFRTTSDEYFARPEPLAATGGVPFELAFIDGLHLFEFALRDFVFAERHSSARGMVFFDDMLPRTVDEAARERHTQAWTGDVFGVLQVLERYRPDLVVVPLDTVPTGLLAVVGLDPDNTVIDDNFTEILAEFRHPDPQPVPAEVLDRSSVVSPGRFLEAEVLELLASRAGDVTAADLRGPLRELVAERLGAAFVGMPV
ncbi:class I SAM-dependent methyltransferase [uncultured Friedmanniella sp.]|uniref:class I SAM-dependent methyltransferase n=1 Tax=uncultured Friedmanniella sp. TaxID=335381 RepID=UPI0035C9E9E8